MSKENDEVKLFFPFEFTPSDQSFFVDNNKTLVQEFSLRCQGIGEEEEIQILKTQACQFAEKNGILPVVIIESEI